MKPPTCTLSASGTLGWNGWYRSGMTMTLNVSGIATSKGISKTAGSTNGYTTLVENNDGTHTYYGYVKNEGGDYTCSTTFSIDKNPPSCSISATGTDGGADWNVVSLTCTGDNLSGCAGNNSVAIGSTQSIYIYDNAGNACGATVEFLTTILHYVPGGATGFNIAIPTYDTLFGAADKHPYRVSSNVYAKQVWFIRYIDIYGNALFKKSDITPYKLNFDVSGATGQRNGRYYGTTVNGGYWTVAGASAAPYVLEYVYMNSTNVVSDLYACYIHYDAKGNMVARYCTDGNMYG